MLEIAIQWIIDAIANMGYLGVFILMLLESAIPVPSEIIMPFSGYLVFLGKFDFWSAVFAGTLGNLVGSLMAYFVGRKFGRSIVNRYGKWLFIEKRDVAFADKWFKKYGDATVFFSRIVPVVRTFISMPAGFEKMDLKKFVLYTIIGSAIWSTFLCWFGFYLGSSWTMLMDIFRTFDIIIIIIGLVALYLWKTRK